MMLSNNILIFITLAFVAGIYVSESLQLPLLFSYGLAIVLAILIASSIFIGRISASLKITVGLFFAMGLISWANFDWLPENNISRFTEQSAILEGIVDEIPQIKKIRTDTIQESYIINVSGIINTVQNEKTLTPVSGKIRLNVYSQEEVSNIKKTGKISYKDKVRFGGKISRIKNYGNPAGLNGTIDLKRQGVTASINAKPEDVKVLETGINQFSWRQKIADWQNSVLNTMQKVMPENEKGILASLVFGSRQGIADNVLKNFAAVGVIHILSVSGAHITLVAGFLNWFGNLLRISALFTAFLTMAGILVYALISGLSPTAIRASIMGAIAIMAVILDREKDAANALAFSALIMLTSQPALIFNISFQLSFSATAGLVFLYRPIKAYLSFLPRWLNEPFSVTIAAQVSSLPFIIWYFNSISLISLIGNLLIVPIIEIVLIMGLLGVLVHAFWPAIAGLIFTIASIKISQTVQLAALLASVPGAVLYLPTIGIFGGGIYYASLFLLYNRNSGSVLRLTEVFKNFLAQKWAKAAIFLCGLGLFFYIWYPKPLAVHFIDVGQGDSSLIITPGGSAVLIDTGGILWADSGFDVGERVVVPYLKHYGVRSLEYLILTHGHQDHSGGAAGIAANLAVNNIVLARENYSSAVQNLLSQTSNSLVIPAYSGQVFEIDGVTFFVEHAETDNSKSSYDSNEVSSVVRVTYGQHSFLLTGDLGADGEFSILSRGSLSPVTVLKVGHHGSKTSTAKEFLDALNPQYAVISVGYNNRFGHPHQDVLTRLAVRDIKIYRTDKNGAVIFHSDGKNLDVECYK